ncbi:lipopolysaccharide biosynthesis protein [Mucilaginibacter lappiensis]|uniref:Chain length determinant protein n=1 Tax=Mucilaginibacter lappiensis TaxID=354630 RepID=A0A841JBT2_9SPHI|nr:lipopolysaccharide biosynthesis protein [Mucilaginibacter lappiensis]MBB6127036.1 hypothetical protein [Mucilaginibacter lappiensis]
MDKTTVSTEISVKEILLKLKAGFNYLKVRWKFILIFSVFGGALGTIHAILKKPTYQAICSFVLEDGSKSGGLGQFSGLASLAGVDISGGGNSGIFQGDNIIELYKSRIMIEKTLLCEVNIAGKKQLLIDRYIEFNKLREQWSKTDQLKNISFIGDPAKFSRSQDSIISDIAILFNKKLLSVGKLDKKLSIIVVNVISEDEVFAREFNLKLVETVNNFYSSTKTKKSNQNVSVLQRQADSVRMVLNNSIGGVATALDASPNANPFLSTLKVSSQKKQIDVQANTAIYGEIIKNLEIAKITLRQDIPLIQVLDSPIYPLDRQKLGKKKALIIGAILGTLLGVIFLLLKKGYKNILES